MVLEKTLGSSLDCKEIKPVNSKGNQPWIFTGRTDAKDETAILWPPDVKSWLIGKDPDAGKYWRWEEKGVTEDETLGWHHWLNGHESEQTPGDSEWQGRLACCNPWGHIESDTTDRLKDNKVSSGQTSGRASSLPPCISSALKVGPRRMPSLQPQDFCSFQSSHEERISTGLVVNVRAAMSGWDAEESVGKDPTLADPAGCPHQGEKENCGKDPRWRQPVLRLIGTRHASNSGCLPQARLCGARWASWDAYQTQIKENNRPHFNKLNELETKKQKEKIQPTEWCSDF